MVGFVYVMSNPSVKELKIGFSDSDPTGRRVKDLQSTGVALPFKVEYYVHAENHTYIEAKVHEELSRFRVAHNREFFLCDIPKAIETIQKIGGDDIIYEKNFYEHWVEHEKSKQKEPFTES